MIRTGNTLAATRRDGKFSLDCPNETKHAGVGHRTILDLHNNWLAIPRHNQKEDNFYEMGIAST